MYRAISWLVVGTMAGLSPGNPTVGVAHPEATLKSTVSSVEAGTILPLTGEMFTEGDPVQLMLRGALEEHELPEITPGEGGVFSIELPIPAEVGAGAYRLVAVASDGEVVASLDLTVLAARPMTEDQGESAAHDDQGRDDMGPVARAGDRPIERSRAGIEWGLIGLLVGLAAGGGVALLRR